MTWNQQNWSARSTAAAIILVWDFILSLLYRFYSNLTQIYLWVVCRAKGTCILTLIGLELGKLWKSHFCTFLSVSCSDGNQFWHWLQTFGTNAVVSSHIIKLGILLYLDEIGVILIYFSRSQKSNCILWYPAIISTIITQVEATCRVISSHISGELYVFVLFPKPCPPCSPRTPPVTLFGNFLQGICRHSIQTLHDCCLGPSRVRKGRWLTLTYF